MILALDLDGVVVLGHPDGGRWDKDLSRDLGIDPKRLQKVFFEPHFQRIVCGEIDLHTVLHAIWPELACDIQAEEFVDYWFSRDSLIDQQLLAKVDAWRARGQAAYLATNQEHLRARYVWESLSLSSRFDGIIYSAALGARKPDKAFFQRAAAQLPQPDARDIIFLDDSPANVEAGAAAGWNSFHYSGVASFDAALAAVGPTRA